VNPESAAKKAQETLDIYAPLAHRLGIQSVKWELEDLAFAVLHPKIYVELESLVKNRSPERDAYVEQVIDAVNDDLRQAKIKAEVSGRPKQFYSIYQKMVSRGRDFNDIHDLTGIRILVSSIRDQAASRTT
jgi:GTP pyrophosphokinase